MSGRTWGWVGLAALVVASGAALLSIVGADVPCGDADAHLGFTPLMRAARVGQVAGIERQLAAGADLEARDRRNGWTPLFHAIHKGQPAAARALIAAGADVETRTKSGWTPLMMATRAGDAETVAALLAAGADPYAWGPHGVNALVTAEQSGETGVKRRLLAAAPDLPRHTARGPLMLARAVHRAQSLVLGGEQ